MKRLLSILLSMAPWVASPGQAHGAEAPVRIGYFPNVTHAQALVGRSGGDFESALGRTVEWRVMNAGPTAMEALQAGALDITYVGPNPAINAYVRSEGRALRVVAGACSGGASLVIRPDSGIQTDKDFHGKKVATPQIGNTQDISARTWLLSLGYRFKSRGGTVTMLPVANFEQLILFKRGQIDAAWSPEPWATRLVLDAGGRRFLDERSIWPGRRFCTALVAVRLDFLESNRDTVKKFLKAHVELTQQIVADPAEAKSKVNQQIARELGKPLSDALLEESWKMIDVTYDPLAGSLAKSAENAFALGYLGRDKPVLAGMVDLAPLNEVLESKKMERIQ